MRNRHSSVSASVVQLAEHRICNPGISVRFRSEALLEFTCGCCGTAFTSHDRRRRYCGRTCAARVNNVGVARNRTTGRHATKPCQHCGRPTRNPNFCSITCSAAAQHARAQAAIARTGRFRSPHSARVYVADRENSRVQIFTPAGEYLREWRFVNRPYDIFIDDQDMLHIAEGGFHNYMMKRSEGPLPAHDQTMIYPPCGHSPIARVTVCDPDGKIAAQVGGENPVLPGNFVAPHGIWADKRGDFYVGEVIVNAGAVKRMAPLRPAGFQKFRRRAG